MVTSDGHVGTGAADVEVVLSRVERTVRRLTALGDDLSDGSRGLAWQGLARDRFDDRLRAALTDLATTRDALARVARLLADARHDRGMLP